MPAKVGDILFAEPHGLQKLERLLQTGADQEIPLRRQAAHEKLERGPRLEMRLEVPRSHGQLVEVG